MARPRTPIGSHGKITIVEVEPRVWRARTRYRFDDGKLRQVDRFAQSKAKANASLLQALTTISASAGVDVKRETTLAALGERFLASKADKAPATVTAYRQSLHGVIVPRIGDLGVAEATPDRLQRFLDSVRIERGPGVAKTARAVLSGMMGLATRSDAVRSNPVRELAAVGGKAKGATAIPLDELPQLLADVRADAQLRARDLVDVIVFIAGTGARISEALAVRWDDVDLQGGTVTIAKSKTNAGERTIAAPMDVVGLLGDRRVAGGPNSHGVAFPSLLGKPRNSKAVAREWAAARGRLGLPDGYTFHAFRKTVATALDQAGLSPRDIAEYLGHSDPSLTMGVYMSKIVGGSRAANALDEVLKN